MPGELANVMSGRVAAVFNLRGANFTTDAACASSLAALDSAQLRQALGPWLHKRQIDAILKRRDQLLREHRARTAAGQRATGT